MNTSQFTSKYRTKLIIDVYNRWIKKGDDILDIGCGTGMVAKILKDKLSIKITGCDVENYLIVNIPFKKIKNNSVPVKDSSYDFALLNDVLHHIEKEQQSAVIEEAARVAKKVLIFEFEPTFIGKLFDIILNKFHYGNLNDPLTQRGISDWQSLFKRLGFKSTAVKLDRPWWYPFSHIAFMVTRK